MADWLVARILGTYSDQIERHLARLKLPSFQPRCLLDRISHGKVCHVVRPIYPNYLFVRSPLRFYHILDLDGVVGIIRCGDAPWRSDLLDRVVEVMIGKLDADGLLPAPVVLARKHAYKSFHKGERVKVTTGVMRGLCGSIEELRGQSAFVWLDGLMSNDVKKRALIKREDLSLLDRDDDPVVQRMHYLRKRMKSSRTDFEAAAA